RSQAFWRVRGNEVFCNYGSGPGGRAIVVAQTAPGASCSIVYQTPAGTSSAAQGLGAKIADASGMVSWSWDIGPSTSPGTGTVAVTCDGAGARTPIEIGTGSNPTAQ